MIDRGPNIGDPPLRLPCPMTIAGEVTIKVGDKITTDHIMPAGDRMKYRSNIPKYAEFVFEPVDPQFRRAGQRNPRCGPAQHHRRRALLRPGLVAGACRLCPMYLGVKAVIAKSFERIHAANLINFGILPLTLCRNGGIRLSRTGRRWKSGSADDP